MNGRTLKIALAVSVALNLFAIAAGVTTLVARETVETRVASEQRSPRERPPLMKVIEGVDPAVRDRVRQDMRASALEARPDFEQSREARRAAIAMAAVEPFDAAGVRLLLERSRLAEARGRERLEADAVEILSALNAEDRKILAPILSRHGGRGERGGRRMRGPQTAPETGPAMQSRGG